MNICCDGYVSIACRSGSWADLRGYAKDLRPAPGLPYNTQQKEKIKKQEHSV